MVDLHSNLLHVCCHDHFKSGNSCYDVLQQQESDSPSGMQNAVARGTPQLNFKVLHQSHWSLIPLHVVNCYHDNVIQSCTCRFAER